MLMKTNTMTVIRLGPSYTPSVWCPRLSPTTVCCSLRNNSHMPKLEPFSRGKLDRIVRDPPLIKKAENDIAGILLSSFKTFLS